MMRQRRSRARLLLGLVLPLAGLAAGASGAAAAQSTRVIELRIESEAPRTVLLEPSADGLLVAEADVPARLFDADRWAALNRVRQAGCAPCLRLDELGVYTEDTTNGRGQLLLYAYLRPERELAMRGKQDASAQHLQRRVGLMGNVFVSGRLTDYGRERVFTTGEDDYGYAGAFDGALSLGPLGVVRGGVRYSQNEDQRARLDRLPTFLENHWIDAQTTFELGEVRAAADPNEGGFRVAGLRARRNFATRPDIFGRPLLNFSTLLERPAVVELFLNSQRVRREEIREPGPVRISDYTPSRPGSVVVLVTDASGTQRVVETDFYLDSRLLGRGVTFFDVAGGLLQDNQGDLRRSGGGAVRLGYGLTEAATAYVFGEGIGFDEDDPLAEGRRHAWSAGTTLTVGSRIGKFDLTGRWVDDDANDAGYSTVLSWQYGWLLPRVSLGMGLTGFYEENYRTLQGESREVRGGRAFVGVGLRRTLLTAAYFQFGDAQGYQVQLAQRFAEAWRLSAGIQQAIESDPLYTLTVARSFGGSVQEAAASARYSEETGMGQYRYSLLGRALDSRLTWFASGEHDDTGAIEGMRADGRLDYRGDSGSVRYSLRGQFDQMEHVVDAATAVIISDRLTATITQPLPSSAGYAVVDVGVPDVVVRTNADSGRSGWRGKVTLPVRGFGRQYAEIDLSSLPLNTVLKKPRLEVSTVPGQGAYAATRIAAPGVLLNVAGARPGDVLLVNGEAVTVYAFGAFAENLMAGSNVVEFKGQRYTFELDEGDPSLPTINLGTP